MNCIPGWKLLSVFPNQIIQDRPEDRQKNNGNDPQDLALRIFVASYDIKDHQYIDDQNQNGY